ncbi:MAG: porin, partial [Rhodobacteraceae bacterium]|nr:porin [Paracoccaceae bacterium]
GNLSNVGYTDVVKGGTATDPDDIAFLTGDAARTSALYAYTLGNASIFVSGTDTTNVTAGTPAKPVNKGAAVGVAYVMGDYTVAVGYENAYGLTTTTTTGTNVGLSASFAGVFGPVKAKALYLTTDAYTSYGASATYTADVLAVTATWINSDGSKATAAAYGLGASYDLGGGLTANAGYAVNGKGTYKYDLGLKFKF